MPSPDQQIVADVAAAVGLAEGESGVRAVLSALARLEPVSTRRISRTVELPVPLVAAICGELRKRDVVARSRPAQLTPGGRRLFAGGGLTLGGPGICAACGGRGLVIPAELRPAGREVAKIAAHAPQARAELDQCHCTFDTKLLRVLALHDADALIGRRILLLGDDDLGAVTLAAVVRRLGSAATVRSLTVLDVDPRVVAFAREKLGNAPFATNCSATTCATRCPDISWVPSTRSSATRRTRSTERACSCPGRPTPWPARAATCSSRSARDDPACSFRVQQSLTEMGFLIRTLVRDFNEYVGAGVLGGTSHLYHLTASSELRPAIAGRFDGPLYTAETEAV